jgi:hypothetical protein
MILSSQDMMYAAARTTNPPLRASPPAKSWVMFLRIDATTITIGLNNPSVHGRPYETNSLPRTA